MCVYTYTLWLFTNRASNRLRLFGIWMPIECLLQNGMIHQNCPLSTCFQLVHLQHLDQHVRSIVICMDLYELRLDRRTWTYGCPNHSSRGLPSGNKPRGQPPRTSVLKGPQPSPKGMEGYKVRYYNHCFMVAEEAVLIMMHEGARVALHHEDGGFPK